MGTDELTITLHEVEEVLAFVKTRLGLQLINSVSGLKHGAYCHQTIIGYNVMLELAAETSVGKIFKRMLQQELSIAEALRLGIELLMAASEAAVNNVKPQM